MWVNEVSLVVGVLTSSSWLFIFINFSIIPFIKISVMVLVLSCPVSNLTFLVFIVMDIISICFGTRIEVIVLWSTRFSSSVFCWFCILSLFNFKIVLWFVIVSLLWARIIFDRILTLRLLFWSFHFSTLSNLFFSHLQKFCFWWAIWTATISFLRSSFVFRNVAPRAVMKMSIILIFISAFPLALIA